MKVTANKKAHMLSLFIDSAALLIPRLLHASDVAGPTPGMSPLWYWAGVLLPVFCGLITLLGGISVYRRQKIGALSKCAMWVGLACIYFLAIIYGDLLQPASFAVMCASRFLVPLIAAWLLGLKPALVLALLPAMKQLSNIPYSPAITGYIVLTALGSFLSVGLFIAELFRLIGGGRLPMAGVVLCAMSDAVLVQMIFNRIAVRTVDSSTSVDLIQYLPFVVISALLHIISKRKVKAFG